MSRPFRVSDKDFLELHNSGKTAIEIGTQLGLSRETVTRYRKRLGVAQVRPNAAWRPSAEWVARAEKMVEGGMSLLEVSRTLGCDEMTVIRRFRGRGWTPQQAGSHGLTMRRANEIFRKI